jgi:hypothetical protein
MRRRREICKKTFETWQVADFLTFGEAIREFNFGAIRNRMQNTEYLGRAKQKDRYPGPKMVLKRQEDPTNL